MTTKKTIKRIRAWAIWFKGDDMEKAGIGFGTGIGAYDVFSTKYEASGALIATWPEDMVQQFTVIPVTIIHELPKPPKK